MKAIPTWNDERTAALVEAVAGKTEVTQADLTVLAESLETTSRSIGSKLRSLTKEGTVNVVVQKASEVARQTWASADEEALKSFLGEQAGMHTYSELAAVFLNGKYTTKQLQGKILSLELTDAVKKAEKVAAVRTYTEAEEAKYVQLATAGATLEEVAQALGKKLQSVRGKGLSLMREGRISEIPAQAQSTASASKEDFLKDIDVPALTVAEIQEATGKSPQGIKNALSRRGISCVDYDGAARRAKLDSKKEAADA